MKSLLLVRHAKSSWPLPSINDFDRPLNERGKANAAMMADRILQKKIRVEAFVSSPAVRALSTCRYFAHAYHKKEKDIILVPELYHAAPEDFYTVIEELPELYSCIALFSHNPGITAFINALTSYKIDQMPTCGIFGVQMAISKWSAFRDAEKQFWFFDYPKNQD